MVFIICAVTVIISIYFMIRNTAVYNARTKVIIKMYELKQQEFLKAHTEYNKISYSYMMYNIFKTVNKIEEELNEKMFGNKGK